MKSNSFSQLVSIVLLFLIIVGSVVFVLPLREKIAALQLTEETYSGELAVLESNYEDLKTLSEEVATSETTRTMLKAAVPVGYDQDALLLELSEITEEIGFKLNAVNFSDTVSETYGNSIEISANFTGTYGDLVSFLQALESADRLMRVTNMSIQRTSSAAVAFNVSIEVYYQ
ncbi:MAG: type 4a pilus biogenesis protein PilO [Patescibacteria group bacterium]